MALSQISQETLDALAQASGAVTGPAVLSQVQASADSIAGLDELDLKSVGPAITFSATNSATNAALGGRS